MKRTIRQCVGGWGGSGLACSSIVAILVKSNSARNFERWQSATSLASQTGVVGGTPRRASAKCWFWLRPTRRSEFALSILALVFTSRHISENSLQHVTGDARALIALHDEWSQRCHVVEPIHLFSDDRMCAVLDAFGCGNPLSASVDAEFVSEMHRRLDGFIGLVVEQCSTSEPEDARAPL